MSRVKNLARGMVSGYAIIIANVVLTMGSIPLALKYLSKAEFGLWALVAQIAGYLAMVDLGMSSSVGRLLIDYKDARGPAYGSMVKTSMLVLGCQGAIAMALGLGLALVPPGWVRVPETLYTEFFWLMVGQALLLGASFQLRIFAHVLYAHQRLDLMNYGQVAQFLTQLPIMWIAFALGAGVYGQLIGAVVGWLVNGSICISACVGLGFWPRTGEWAAASRQKFREIFHYGADLFAVSLGGQLITSSQTILASRLLGIDAAAVWAVATKAFSLVFQLVWRIWAAAMPAFAEMQAQGDEPRIRDRYRQLFTMVTTLGAVAAVLFAVCNGPFLAVLTNGKISWAPWNDWLLGLWLLLLAQACGHANLIMSLKQIRALKWMYAIEGVTFVLVCLAVGRGGFSLFLASSIACTAVFTLAYGTWRIARLVQVPVGQVALVWQTPMLKVLVGLSPIALGLRWLGSDWPAIVQLPVLCAIVGLAGVALFLRYGLSLEWGQRLEGHLPTVVRTGFASVRRAVGVGQHL